MDECRFLRRRRPMLGRTLLGLLALTLPGCAPQWYLSFAEADQQRRADRAAGRPERTLFLFYKDHLDPNSGRMMEVLESPQIKPLLADKVRCMLLKDFPPNQRYLAQFEVASVPAIVLVHPDGTYHAREGLLSVEQTRQFLTTSVPPGAQPRGEGQALYVPEYVWLPSYEDAVKTAARQNRKLLILYKWWLSSESNELITRLSNARIRQHLNETVGCMLDWDHVPNRTVVARYGISKVPAIIIVHQDGTYHALMGLPTVDQIIQFVTNARAPGRVPTYR